MVSTHDHNCGQGVNPGLSDIRRHLISSASASIIADTCTMPISTLKTNVQNAKHYTPMAVILKNIYRIYGIRGFYNASGWTMGSQIVSITMGYTLYRSLQSYIPNTALAGLAAGLLSSIVVHPLDVIKIHSQMHTPILHEIHKHGTRMLYRGYTKSLSKSAVGSLCYFPLYDFFNTKLSNAFQAAIITAVLSTTILQPFDYMKTRHVYNQPYHARSLFTGLSLNLMRVVPHFTITMITIDYINRKIAPRIF